MDERGLFVRRAGGVWGKGGGKKKKSLLHVVYLFVCTGPTETHLRKHACQESRKQTRGNIF